MSLEVGARIGPYQITGTLGAGGMGEVYRARDPRLNRDVALKALPDVFAADPERLARFRREAQVLASLNHPNIGHIYGLEEGGDTPLLVLELVDGPTLADRIADGPIPLAEALALGKQVAEGLEAAHEHGVVHRDVKPANIKITHDGVVKVLDFGPAKVASGDTASPDLTRAPTVTVAGTREGVMLGTAAYMSPEQARGKPADKRTDIWAFGCVLYEMLTGRAAFSGATVSDTIAAILERQPSWAALPTTTPPNMRRLLQRCLEKDPKRRLRDIGDARFQIEDASGEPSMSGPAVSRIRKNRERASWLAAMVVVVTSSILTAPYLSRAPVDAPEIRLEITTPPTTDPVSLAISPDGRKVVFTGTSEGQTRLWVRSLGLTLAQPLTGTDGATFPFWSPDSQSIGFFADRQLKRIDVDSGTIQALAGVEGGRGGAWAEDGTILFQPTPGVGPLFRISAGGGRPTATTAQYGRSPQFLPDQRHFFYFRPGAPDVRGVYLSQLEGSDGQRLLDTEAAAVYASGHLLFVRQRTMFAQAFDTASLAMTGDPFAIAEGLTVNGPLLSAPVAASSAGPIVYRTGSSGGLRQFAWFDRSGNEIGKVGGAVANLLSPSISPDESRVAVHRLVAGNTDIWLLETRRGVLSRFTSDPVNESSPLWAPDSTRVVFSSSRNGPGDLFEKNVTTGAEELLLETPLEKWPTGWSPDGRYLLYLTRDATTRRDLWVLPMQKDRKPFPVANTEADEEDGQFAPDGKWIAYQSNESGAVEVYVQPFPTLEARYRFPLTVELKRVGDGTGRSCSISP